MNLSIYKFRTPSLRNVALTAPYGHCGAYPTLKSVIWHHVNPSTAVARYNPEATQMPNTRTLTAEDAAVMQNSTGMTKYPRTQIPEEILSPKSESA